MNINTLGLMGNLDEGRHYVFNVACGATTDLLSIWNMIKEITGSSVDPVFGPVRKDDILFSLNQPSRVQDDCLMGCKLLLYRNNGSHVWDYECTVRIRIG